MRSTTCRISVVDAVAILNILGSDGDPIYRHDVETTPQDLAYSDVCDKDARRFLISYATSKGPWRKGSLLSMVLDRLGVR